MLASNLLNQKVEGQLFIVLFVLLLQISLVLSSFVDCLLLGFVGCCRTRRFIDFFLVIWIAVALALEGACSHVLEELKDLLTLLVCIRVLDNTQELGEFDHARSVFVNGVDNLLNLLSRFGKAKSDQRVFKLFNTDTASSILV